MSDRDLIDGGSTGPVLDTAAGDVVSINVNPDGPYGLSLVAFSDGNAAVVYGFERLPTGELS